MNATCSSPLSSSRPRPRRSSNRTALVSSDRRKAMVLPSPICPRLASVNHSRVRRSKLRRGRGAISSGASSSDISNVPPYAFM